MSKKTCYSLFAAASILLIAAIVFKINAVTIPAQSIFAAMKNPYLAGSAVLISLLLKKQKHYGLIILGCAVLAALLVQLFVIGGALTLMPVVYKSAAFLVYAFLVTLLRFMI